MRARANYPLPLTRVRREELYCGSSSEDGSARSETEAVEDAELRAKLNARLSSLLGLDLPPSPAEEQQSTAIAVAAHDETAVNAAEMPQEEEFEFRLFSTSASKTAAPAKVVLAASDDEDADLGEGGFTVPTRPVSYYVVGEPSAEELKRYQQAATTGEDILLGARKRAWGLERPWKVVGITVPHKTLKELGVAKPLSSQTGGGGDNVIEKKRKRPGKKRRIAVRIKIKAEKDKQEKEAELKMSKEEHLKEKKKRLNRERKLKRRAKEREKKQATKGEEGEGGDGQPASEAADSGSEDESV